MNCGIVSELQVSKLFSATHIASRSLQQSHQSSAIHSKQPACHMHCCSDSVGCIQLVQIRSFWAEDELATSVLSKTQTATAAYLGHMVECSARSAPNNGRRV